jgi:site-specific DNA-methyltransferase (adenine-specific)
MSITNNTLFYGDNLPILRDYIASESVDLVYLDPPFNSSRSYNAGSGPEQPSLGL